MFTYSHRTASIEKASSLLSELSNIWGASSTETRNLATLRSQYDAEARALEEFATALSVEAKSPEEISHSLTFIRKVAPSLDVRPLLKALESVIQQTKLELICSLKEENASSAFSASSLLEKCDAGAEAENAFEEARHWKVSNSKDWIQQARKEKLLATKSFPNSSRATAAFDKAATRSVKEFFQLYFMGDGDDPKKRAMKLKVLSDNLHDLKESCGQATGAKSSWDSKFQEMKSQIRLDAHRAILEHPPVRWSSTFHGVDPACVEAFGLLQRSGNASEAPPVVLTSLLDRLRDSSKGGETDLFALLGCCNTLDFIVSYLHEFTPERNRALAMLRSSKEGFVKRACAELERSGEQFVKQTAKYFQVQNPVLRTELRLEISKAWKTSALIKRQSGSTELNNSSSNLDDSFNTSTTNNNEVGGLVALFFEGSTSVSGLT